MVVLSLVNADSFGTLTMFTISGVPWFGLCILPVDLQCLCVCVFVCVCVCVCVCKFVCFKDAFCEFLVKPSQKFTKL